MIDSFFIPNWILILNWNPINLVLNSYSHKFNIFKVKLFTYNLIGKIKSFVAVYLPMPVNVVLLGKYLFPREGTSLIATPGHDVLRLKLQRVLQFYFLVLIKSISKRSGFITMSPTPSFDCAVKNNFNDINF